MCSVKLELALDFTLSGSVGCWFRTLSVALGYDVLLFRTLPSHSRIHVSSAKQRHWYVCLLRGNGVI